MLVAGLGQLSQPHMKYLLGIVVSKGRGVYSDQVCRQLQLSLSGLTRKAYYLTLIKINDVVTEFIITDYDKRMGSLEIPIELSDILCRSEQ